MAQPHLFQPLLSQPLLSKITSVKAHSKILTLCTVLSLVFILSACDKKEDEAMRPILNLQPTSYEQLSGWHDDNQQQALAAFKNSCAPIAASKRQGDFDRDDSRFGTWDQWRAICADLSQAIISDDQDARLFFETHFTPHHAWANDQDEGMFTGYYVASLNGASSPDARYKYPIYAKPDDLVMVDLGEFRADLKGRRIAGTVKNGRLRPYADRTAIEDKGLDVDVLLWADDLVDVFFLHIQGSGRVTMRQDKNEADESDNSAYRFVGYAGQNGHPYHAIGKFLIQDEQISREDMSMQAIREWLKSNPDKAEALLNKNPSYVFFRELEREGAVGGQNIVLTSERSLAIDHTYYPYGLPIWLDAAHPVEDNAPLRRLMIGQDTGGAIRGPVRGDVFWGYGAQAEALAGKMKSTGKMTVLLPR
jgi:membrane-bound lytic murein transglycosylase A